MKIAFIGLGNMGGGMSANLVKAGHEVRAFDLMGAARDAARDHGCAAFDDAREAVGGVDAVVTMLPNGGIVKSVYEGSVIGHAPAGAVLLDCSTIDVATARAVIGAAHAAGYDMVDAPVSGGIAAANGGTLTFMVGGSDTAFARAKPILEGMGKAVIHAGDAGNGQAAKICNNMLLGIHMIGTCEAFAMAEKLGLDPQTFYDISSVSSGQCWSMTSYCPVPGVGPDHARGQRLPGRICGRADAQGPAPGDGGGGECRCGGPAGQPGARALRRLRRRGQRRGRFRGIIRTLK